MKNRLYSIAIYVVFLIPFVAPWEGGRHANGGFATEGISFNQAVSQDAAIFMPVLDWELADLDVRDAHNQSIQDASAVQNLSALFTSSLFELAVVRDIHIVDQIWCGLEAFSRLFNNLIFNIVYPLWQAVSQVWQPSTKRFVHNVHNVWITLSVGLLLSLLLLHKIFEKSSHQRLILRC